MMCGHLFLWVKSRKVDGCTLVEQTGLLDGNVCVDVSRLNLEQMESIWRDQEGPLDYSIDSKVIKRRGLAQYRWVFSWQIKLEGLCWVWPLEFFGVRRLMSDWRQVISAQGWMGLLSSMSSAYIARVQDSDKSDLDRKQQGSKDRPLWDTRCDCMWKDSRRIKPLRITHCLWSLR